MSAREQAIRECAALARSIKGGFTVSLEDGGGGIQDPDGPWVLNSTVADAILGLLEKPVEAEPEELRRARLLRFVGWAIEGRREALRKTFGGNGMLPTSGMPG